MTGMWKTPLNLAEIVRWQFGWKYDGSEARHSRVNCHIQQSNAGFAERNHPCHKSNAA